MTKRTLICVSVLIETVRWALRNTLTLVQICALYAGKAVGCSGADASQTGIMATGTGIIGVTAIVKD